MESSCSTWGSDKESVGPVELGLRVLGQRPVCGVDDQAVGLRRGWLHAAAALGEIGGPVSIVQGKRGEEALLQRGGLVASLNKFAGMSVVDAADANQRGRKDQVGVAQVFALGDRDRNRDGLGQNVGQRLKLTLGWNRRAEVDGNHNVSAHVAGDIGGEIIHQAAIDQDVALPLDRREDSRHRHGGAHRTGQIAVAEDEGFAGFQLGGNAAERGGELSEVLHRRVGKNLAGEK